MGKVIRILADDGDPAEYDTETGKMTIERPDGSLVIREKNAQNAAKRKKSKHDANLAEELGESYLGSVATDLIEGIQSDIASNKDRNDDVVKAIRLLGIKVEDPKSATVEGQSVVRSPIMLDALLSFQANADAEMLPAAGPVKIRVDTDVDDQTEQLADDLETDMNHYLTVVATEYYPDTRRMLFDDTGLSGAGFKKVSHDPLLRRPTSVSVPSEDLIVNAGARDLSTAQRVTHRFFVAQSRMRRLQLKGFYRDCALGQPAEVATELASSKAAVQGVSALTALPRNYRHTVYECYCELDLEGFEHKQGGEPTGLPLPYRVTIDRDSAKVLEVRRDWDEDDEQFMRSKTFVKFPFIEALGFYGIGLAHLLGNISEAMTATWRLLLDAGMFSSFPGFLYAKDMAKAQETSIMRVAPGTGRGIQTGGKPIGDFVMPLPYKEPSPAFIELGKLLTDAGQRTGGIPTAAVGEGKQDAPVGTTLALLEQATKMMAAVHKGLCSAQAEELQLLKARFAEDPEAFWRFNKKPARQWDAPTLLAALKDNDLVPMADPNTPSHMHRIMRAVALVQMATAFPTRIDQDEVIKIVLKTLGWKSESLLMPPPPPQAQPAQPTQLPVDPVGMASVQAKTQTDQAKIAADTANSAADRESRERIAAMNVNQKSQSDIRDAQLAQAQLQLQAHIAALKNVTGGNQNPFRGGGRVL